MISFFKEKINQIISIKVSDYPDLFVVKVLEARAEYLKCELIKPAPPEPTIITFNYHNISFVMTNT
jgi:hypothetical protein